MSKTKARIAAASAAVALIAGVQVVAASPASAKFDGNCGAGEFCLYFNTNYSGGLADFPGDISNYTNYNFWGTVHNLNDNSASGKNYSSWIDVHMHEHANYGGAGLEFNPNQWRSNFGSSWINRGSSHRW
ncbi:peptidase inhibitor family I36 protein [Micromonospora chersina]|uniref:peptidase inhibitor family I36 protein n=1 Tax=Micromonospora chersina TaxID=47854 RepID=UPI0033A2EF58